jgi:hypothetical protein
MEPAHALVPPHDSHGQDSVIAYHPATELEIRSPTRFLRRPILLMLIHR